MCTPWTMTWHIRWRVRDWTSCLSPYSSDHELASSPQGPVRKNMAFDKRKDNSHKPNHNKNLSRPREECNKKRHLNKQMDKEKEGGVPVGNRVDDDSIRPLSADEDYIVFSFREDGAFDVVEDCKGVKSEIHTSVDGKHRNSRPVNRKLEYGEGAEQVSDRHHHMHEKRSNANQWDTDQHDQDFITPFNEDEENETILYLSRTQRRDDNIRATCQSEEIEDRGVVSAESRDSNQSEGSTGSFAFPVLGWEWIGSPVKMPESEDLHLKKQKIRCVRFQCCRF